MPSRNTTIKPKGAPSGYGLMVEWVADRAEMIAAYRKHYEHQLRRAELALDVADEDLEVFTHVGVHVLKDRREVTQ